MALAIMRFGENVGYNPRHLQGGQAFVNNIVLRSIPLLSSIFSPLGEKARKTQVAAMRLDIKNLSQLCGSADSAKQLQDEMRNDRTYPKAFWIKAVEAYYIGDGQADKKRDLLAAIDYLYQSPRNFLPLTVFIKILKAGWKLELENLKYNYEKEIQHDITLMLKKLFKADKFQVLPPGLKEQAEIIFGGRDQNESELPLLYNIIETSLSHFKRVANDKSLALDVLKDEKAILAQRVREQAQDINAFQQRARDQLEAHEAEKAKLLGCHKQLEETNEEKERQIGELKGRNHALVEEIERQKAYAVTEIRSRDAKIRSLESEKVTLKETNDEMRTILKQQTALIERISQELFGLREEVASLKKKVALHETIILAPQLPPSKVRLTRSLSLGELPSFKNTREKKEEPELASAGMR